MSFLVILICLTINYLWLKDFDRFDDGWFFRFRCYVESAMTDTINKTSRGWMLSALIIYAVPMLLLLSALLIANGRGFGIPSMLLHILVLLVAFDRTQPGKLAADFLAKWKSSDFEAAELYVQQELPKPELAAVEDHAGLLDYFCKQLIYRSFEKMFVMFFWYMLAGPLGVLFSYLSYQLRDSHGDDQSAGLVATVSEFVWGLEWIPMRLLAMTFSLAGNFVQCFESVKKSFWNFSLDTDNAALLYSYSGCALASAAGSKSDSGQCIERRESDIAQGESRVESLLALLERSQAIWLAVLALITVLG